MGVSVESVARQAAAAVDTDANLVLLGEDWVNARLEEAAARSKFRYLRDLGSLVIPAVVTTGTVTVARDSDEVVPDVAATAVWDETLVGRFFQVFARTTWTEIVRVDPVTKVISLRSPFAELSSAGVSYRIAQRFTALDRQARKLGPFIYQRFRTPLDLIAYERLQTLAPERQYYSFGPTMVAEAGENAEGTKVVEFYPYSIQSEQILYVFWRKPKRYGFTEDLPGSIDAGILKEGVLVDVYRYEWARATRAGQMDRAIAWERQMRMQEATWRERMELLALQDHGVDDAQFIYAMAAGQGIRILRDIKTAADEVFARGSRP